MLVTKHRANIAALMKLQPSTLEAISHCGFFKELQPDEFQAVVQEGRPYHIKQGQYFFHQGEPATHFYVIGEGEVKLSQINADGQQTIVAYLGSSHGLGIIVVLSQTKYPVAAEAVTDCVALQFDHEITRLLMLKYPQLAINGMELVVEQFTALQNRLEQMATQRVEQRVARSILQLVRQFGTKSDEGVLIDMPLSRQDLAEMTGTNLYNVSRIMSKWEQDGIIKTGRKRVILCQPHELVVIAEDLPK